MRRHIRLPQIILLAIAASNPFLVADLYSQDLRTELPKLIGRTLSVKPPEGAVLRPLEQPLDIHSLSTIDEESTRPYLVLWSVPSVGEREDISFSGPSVSSLLGNYFADQSSFELGYANLTPEQTSQLEKANAILFTDVEARTPSKKFDRFRKWESDRKLLLDEIQNAAGDVSRQMSLNQRLQVLDRDYRLLGEKDQVLAALEVLDRSTSQATLFEPQLVQLRTNSNLVTQLSAVQHVFERIASPAAWVRVSADAEQSDLVNSVKCDLLTAGNQTRTFTLTVRAISLQAIVTRVDQPGLSSDILGNRAWRRRDKRILSDGDQVASPNETIPRYVSDILVIRNVDITLDANSEDYPAFASAIKTAQRGMIGGLPIQFTGPGSTSVLLNHFYLSSPIVVAAIVTPTPKTPNQLPDLDWK